MRRFFVEKRNISGGRLTIINEEAHHMKDVIRLKNNDKFIAFDGEGSQYICRIRSLSADKIEAIIEEKKKTTIKIPDVTLACAIPKSSKMDDLIQKAAELRVKTLIPILTARGIVKISQDKIGAKIKRWEKIAKESSKQCGRDDVLKIKEPGDFKEVVSDSNNYKLKLIPCICDDAKPIKTTLAAIKAESVLILVGPEGDFAPAEVELAKSFNFVPVSLGPVVLRVDTACFYILSIIMYELFCDENL